MEKRAPGSPGERKAGEYMADVLRHDCGCESVSIEAFDERPSAFYRYFRFSATFDCLCAVCFFVPPWLSALFGVAALLIFPVQFAMYNQMIDPLFPVKQSINVTALRSCTGG